MANELDLGLPAERGGETVGSACRVTGVYQSSCACAVRTAFAAGDPFTVCPACQTPVRWQFLGGTGRQ